MVVLLRHGATPENDAKPEILRGVDDPALSDTGREEIQRAAEKICHLPVLEVRSDSFLRDTESRAIVADACDVPEVDAPELAPYNIGELSGHAKQDVWPIIKFLLENPDVPAPGGETRNEFLNRWANYWWKVYSEYGGRDDVAVVLIVHGTELRALDLILYGEALKLDYEEHVKTGEMLLLH